MFDKVQKMYFIKKCKQIFLNQARLLKNHLRSSCLLQYKCLDKLVLTFILFFNNNFYLTEGDALLVQRYLIGKIKKV